MIFDLHIHTAFSDGDFAPTEILTMARQKGLGGIAITDHDECRGFGEIADADAGGLFLCPGIELAAKFEGEVHVLGLGIDWQDKTLLKHIDKTAEARLHRAAKMLKKLQDAGIDLYYDEIRNECTGNVIGRPHFAAALVKKGYVQTHKEAFLKYLGNHAPFYIPFEKVSVKHAAELIAAAGGKPVLAHPGFIREDVLMALAPKLSGMGFWGIEAYHPSHSDSQCDGFERLAKRYGLFVTAGSDFHGGVKPKINLGMERRGGAFLIESLEVLTSR